MIDVTTTIEVDSEGIARAVVPAGVSFRMDVADFHRIRATRSDQRAGMSVKGKCQECDRQKLEDALLIAKVVEL